MIRSIQRISAAVFCLFLTLPLFAGGQTESPSGQDSADRPGTEYVRDAAGHDVRVPEKADRIVCLNSGLSVLTAALGKTESIVGRDTNSTFPHALKKVYVVAGNSSSPNIELILEKRPDLVLADNMLPDKAFEKLTALGISVAVFKTSDPRVFDQTISGVGALTGRSVQARKLLEDLNSRTALVEELASRALAEGAEPQTVFFENRKPYKSTSAKSGSHLPIAGAGGINIAADEPVSSPKLSAEYVLERNPDVIIRRVSGDGTAEVMENTRNTIMRRTGLEDVRAVRDGRVYIIKSDLFLLLRYPVGMAYLGSWFYPEAFADLDPEEFHKSLISDLFGPEEWDRVREDFVYP